MSDRAKQFYVSVLWAAEFAILAWLLFRALSPKVSALKLSVFGSGAYALFDELHQVYIKGRGGRMSDVVIDWIGIGAFLLIWHCSWSKKWKLVASLLGVIAIFLLSIFPMPTFSLPGAPQSGRFNP